MGASRYIATRDVEFVDGRGEQQTVKAGDVVAANHKAVAAQPDAFRDGDVPLEAPAGFDPADHTVDEVLEHLDSADENERDRVLTAELAGKARKTIVGEEHPGTGEQMVEVDEISDADGEAAEAVEPDGE